MDFDSVGVFSLPIRVPIYGAVTGIHPISARPKKAHPWMGPSVAAENGASMATVKICLKDARLKMDLDTTHELEAGDNGHLGVNVPGLVEQVPNSGLDYVIIQGLRMAVNLVLENAKSIGSVT